MGTELELSTRKAANIKLKAFDFLAKENDFIEVTEWTNGEGWDIAINDKIISLTIGQLDAINYLTKSIDINK